MVNLDLSKESCPECGAKFRLRMEDLAKGRTVHCPRGHSIKLLDDGGGAHKAQDALDDLEKSLRKIDKNFRF
jgi:predicted Zn finger-like uncharacterized protein